MQQLHSINISVNIGEALEARTKDPLWFLARQWQTGEFSAENGGRPAYFSVDWREHAFTRLIADQHSQDINLDAPLEFAVEQENEAGDSPAWSAAALEYRFQVETASHHFDVEEYHGRRLDWYHFSHAQTSAGASPEVKTQRFTPTQIHLPGAPHPRWWRMEEAPADFDLPQDPEPNTLSMLLPEFFYLDVNNWYVTPLPANAGVLREVVSVQVVDSFGVTTKLGPAINTPAADGWQLFVIAPAENVPAGLDGRFLLLPNVAQEVLYNDDIEDVRFIRDEEANLVWAIEHRYRLTDGTFVVDGGTPQPKTPAQQPQPGGQTAGRSEPPSYKLRSETLAHQIPYIPRQIDPGRGTNGETYLRRGRTLESASNANTQYHTKIVGESWRLNEEEIPRSGTRVRRIARYARGSDGCSYHWVGRLKETGRPARAPDLRFDYLEGIETDSF